MLASATYGLREVLGHDGGLLLPPGDRAGWADGLARAVGDAELRARLGSQGRARFLAFFTQSRMHERFVAEFDRLTGARGLDVALTVATERSAGAAPRPLDAPSDGGA